MAYPKNSTEVVLRPTEVVLDPTECLKKFVELYNDRPKQRTAPWHKMKETTIGGSELAALLKMSPYSSFNKVLSLKSKISSWGGGGSTACWWGSMFESAIERFVEVDCGTTLYGTDINIAAPAGSGLEELHANSPDGFCVVTLYWDGDEWALLTTDKNTGTEAPPTVSVIVLVEFKCPYARKPEGKIPRHYKAQVWSGLALAPVAKYGLFVDAVFRRTPLHLLGNVAGYNTSYHRRDKPPWELPVAWGYTAVYAPRFDHEARERANQDDVDDVGDLFVSTPAHKAWEMHYRHFGEPFESFEQCEKRGARFQPDPVDLGECDDDIFDETLGLVDRGEFPFEHVGPCFPDGRGAPLGNAAEIRKALAKSLASPPKGHYLMGVIPWKVMEVDYVFQARQPYFLDRIYPLVTEVLDAAKKVRGSPEPYNTYCTYVSRNSKPAKKKDGISQSELNSFFDFIR